MGKVWNLEVCCPACGFSVAGRPIDLESPEAYWVCPRCLAPLDLAVLVGCLPVGWTRH